MAKAISYVVIRRKKMTEIWQICHFSVIFHFLCHLLISFLSDFLIFLKCQIDRNGISVFSDNTYWQIIIRLYNYSIESVYEIRVLLFLFDHFMIFIGHFHTFWYILFHCLSKCQNLLFSRFSKRTVDYDTLYNILIASK